MTKKAGKSPGGSGRTPRCTECGAGMAKADDIMFRGYRVQGLRCAKCGHEELDLEQAGGVIKLEKMRKEGFRTKVFKCGNSFAVRLPKAVVEAFGLAGKEVEVSAKGRTIKLAT